MWKFVVVYIDDVIVFSATPEQYVHDLDIALSLLEDAGVMLALAKCFFAQPSIQALSYKIFKLDLSILEEKVEAIQKWTFPNTLSQLEKALGFFGYYRKFVPYYAAIAAPLIELKIIGFRNGSREGRKRSNYAESTPIPLPLIADAPEYANLSRTQKTQNTKAKAKSANKDIKRLMFKCIVAF